MKEFSKAITHSRSRDLSGLVRYLNNVRSALANSDLILTINGDEGTINFFQT